MKIDVLRIMAETYHALGEQAMAEYYLSKIPRLNFLYYEIAAAIQNGEKRLESIEQTECLCIDKLISILAMRKEEEKDPHQKANIDQQVHDMLNFFKGYPAYREIAEIMEQHWEHETIMKLYQWEDLTYGFTPGQTSSMNLRIVLNGSRQAQK